MEIKKRTVSIIRLIARIWGSLLFIFVLIMVGGELIEHLTGEPRFFFDSFSDLVGVLFFPVFCIGVLIAFKWEGIGGLIIIGAVIITQIADGKLTLDLLSGLFTISGLLFILYSYLSQGKKEILEST